MMQISKKGYKSLLSELDGGEVQHAPENIKLRRWRIDIIKQKAGCENNGHK